MSQEPTKEKLSVPAILTIAAIIVVGGLLLAKSRMPQERKNQAPPTEKESQSANIPPVTAEDISRGPENTKVTLVFYSDSQCPYCRQFYPSIKRLMDQDKELRVVYRHAPFHKTAWKETEAMDCALEQGKFWEYMDAIYTSADTENISDPARLTKIAAEKGLQEKEFSQCLTSGKYTPKIDEYLNKTREAKVRGTPFALAIGEKRSEEIIGAVSYEELKSTVDSLK